MLYELFDNAMVDLVESHLTELQALCKKHQVLNLYLFGSAAKGGFKATTSDLDFAVEFLPTLEPIEYTENFFSLIESLELLFETDIDLVSRKALKNDVIIQEIEDSKVHIYAAQTTA